MAFWSHQPSVLHGTDRADPHSMHDPSGSMALSMNEFPLDASSMKEMESLDIQLEFWSPWPSFPRETGRADQHSRHGHVEYMARSKSGFLLGASCDASFEQVMV